MSSQPLRSEIVHVEVKTRGFIPDEELVWLSRTCSESLAQSIEGETTWRVTIERRPCHNQNPTYHLWLDVQKDGEALAPITDVSGLDPHLIVRDAFESYGRQIGAPRLRLFTERAAS